MANKIMNQAGKATDYWEAERISEHWLALNSIKEVVPLNFCSQWHIFICVYSFFGVLTLLGSFTLIFQGQILTIYRACGTIRMDGIVFWPASKRHSMNACIRSSLHNLFPSKEINFVKIHRPCNQLFLWKRRINCFWFKKKHIVTLINFFWNKNTRIAIVLIDFKKNQ